MKPFLCIVLIALASVGCKKDDPEAGLPPATKEGKNTGGGLVNGEPFVAVEQGGSLLTNPFPALDGGFAFDSVYYVTLSGKHQGQRATVLLFLRSQVTGTYLLNRTTAYYPQGSPRVIFNHATFTVSGSHGEVYVTNAQNTGQVVMTRADIARGISAGTFEFTAASTVEPSKTVTVTKGRFDRLQ